MACLTGGALRQNLPKWAKPFWLNFYGAPAESDGAVAQVSSLPLQNWLFTPELQWESRGKWRISQGRVAQVSSLFGKLLGKALGADGPSAGGPSSAADISELMNLGKLPGCAYRGRALIAVQVSSPGY
jgi:hypothetical protein